MWTLKAYPHWMGMKSTQNIMISRSRKRESNVKLPFSKLVVYILKAQKAFRKNCMTAMECSWVQVRSVGFDGSIRCSEEIVMNSSNSLLPVEHLCHREVIIKWLGNGAGFPLFLKKWNVWEVNKEILQYLENLLENSAEKSAQIELISQTLINYNFAFSFSIWCTAVHDVNSLLFIW